MQQVLNNEKLLQDIRDIRQQITDLLMEIEHVSLQVNPQIEVDYAIKIGCYENELLQAQIAARRAKHKFGLAQARKNRGEEINEELIEQELDEEFAVWEAQLTAQVQDYLSKLETRAGTRALLPHEQKELRALHRELVKRLHPDLHAHQSEEERRLFNMLQGSVMDARVLDLFAGSGALSLEALSRGAAFAVLADRDREACRVERNNLEKLGFTDRARVMNSEWERTLRTLSGEGERFDLIFLDPPYAMTDLREVTEKLKPLMTPEARIVIEHRAGAEIAAADGLEIVKERSWGYCGVKIYEQLCDSGIV